MPSASRWRRDCRHPTRTGHLRALRCGSLPWHSPEECNGQREQKEQHGTYVSSGRGAEQDRSGLIAAACECKARQERGRIAGETGGETGETEREIGETEAETGGGGDGARKQEI